MSVWGSGLYQCDDDFEILDLIAEKAAEMFYDPDCLRCPLMPAYLTLRSPFDKPATVEQLNIGVLHRLLRWFETSENDMAVILSAAVAMELGVVFTKDDMHLVRQVVNNAAIGSEKRDQMLEALEGYKNDGTEWKFESKDLVESTMTSTSGTGNGNDEAEELPQMKEGDTKTKDFAETAQVAVDPTKTSKPSKSKKEDGADHLFPKELKSAMKKSKETDQPHAVAFRLPRSKSHPSLKMQESKKSHSKKTPPNQSKFTLPVKVQSMDDKVDAPKQSDSIFRLPPPKSLLRGLKREVRKF
ncbi:MAG: hypothetical protein Q9219_004417 [cf. Caloplaca sp. 3 TL-2023]